MQANDVQFAAAPSAATIYVQVVVYSRLESIRERIARALDQDATSLPSLRLTLDCPTVQSDENFADYIAERAGTVDGLLIVSDCFANPPASEQAEGDNLARLLRERSSGGRAILALLGIVEPPITRIAFVDTVVYSRADQDAFRESMRHAFCAIHYRVRPQRKKIAGAAAVGVHAVEAAKEFRACLALRHNVYRLLGYFHNRPDGEDAGLELDYYDQTSLHFAAVKSDADEPQLAGTARLIIASTRKNRESLFGDGDGIRARSRTLCESIITEHSTLQLELERGPGSAALPLFAAFSFDDIASDPGAVVGDFGEVSRVVVAEEFRGLGVSRLLVRACIAAALELRLRYVVLECIPQHVPLYEQFGFCKIADTKHQRAWGIDQLAAVMMLALQDIPNNAAVQLAHRDIDMLRAARVADAPASLCLCHNPGCWVKGGYAGRGGLQCPLRTTFKPDG